MRLEPNYKDEDELYSLKMSLNLRYTTKDFLIINIMTHKFNFMTSSLNTHDQKKTENKSRRCQNYRARQV